MIMLRTSLLAACALFAGAALAQGSIAECDFHMEMEWIIGKCPTGNGDEQIESSVYLNSKIMNDQGALKVSRCPAALLTYRWHPLLTRLSVGSFRGVLPVMRWRQQLRHQRRVIPGVRLLREPIPRLAIHHHSTQLG